MSRHGVKNKKADRKIKTKTTAKENLNTEYTGTIRQKVTKQQEMKLY